MRARYICVAHCGQSGRALIGVFSCVYSENVEAPLFAGGSTGTLSHRRLTEIAVGDVPRYDLFLCGTVQNGSLSGLWITKDGSLSVNSTLTPRRLVGNCHINLDHVRCKRRRHYDVEFKRPSGCPMMSSLRKSSFQRSTATSLSVAT